MTGWINEYGITIDRDLANVRDRARASLTHAGVKGTSLEHGLTSALSAVLGTQYRVGTGQIVDSKDRLSGQVDLILYDDSQPFTPVVQGSPGIYLADSTLAAIEVKTSLTATHIREITSPDGGGARLKRLRRTFLPGDRISSILYPSEFLRFYNSIGSILFAFEAGASHASIGRALSNAHILVTEIQQTRYELPMIDAVFVLGQGVFLNMRAVLANDAIGFTFDNGRDVEDFGTWRFFPAQVDGEDQSTVMRLAFFLAYATPRIRRHMPSALHYLGEPGERLDLLEPADQSVAEYLSGTQIDAAWVHRHGPIHE